MIAFLNRLRLVWFGLVLTTVHESPTLSKNCSLAPYYLALCSICTCNWRMEGRVSCRFFFIINPLLPLNFLCIRLDKLSELNSVPLIMIWDKWTVIRKHCIRTLPRGGMYWEIHPLRPWASGGDFTPLGPQEISWSLGAAFPNTPLLSASQMVFFWSIKEGSWHKNFQI